MIDSQTFSDVLSEIASGESARKALVACGADERGFWRYLAKDEKAAQQYARARAQGLERMAEEILEIADDESLPADSRRVRVDPRKWLLSKLAPKKYGDKIETTHQGPDGGPVQSRVTVEFVGASAGGVSLPVADKG